VNDKQNHFDVEDQEEPLLIADESPPPSYDRSAPTDRVDSVWIPAGRTLREELSRPRYVALLLVALVAIGLQLWLLF